MQENVEDFVSLPISLTKNDPKYQTLPYNAKLFAPFATKHEQDQFEKSMQQMQIIQQDHPLTQYRQNNQHNHHLQQQQVQSNNNSNGITSSTSNNERIQSYNNRNSNNNLQQQLQNFLSQQHQQQQQQQNNQQIAKSANIINAVSSSQSSSSLIAASSSTTTTPKNIPNGLQTVHSTQASNNVSRGKAMPIIGNSCGSESTTFPIVRPSNFLPTGAPASSPSESSNSAPSAVPLPNSTAYNGLPNSQVRHFMTILISPIITQN